MCLSLCINTAVGQALATLHLKLKKKNVFGFLLRWELGTWPTPEGQRPGHLHLAPFCYPRLNSASGTQQCWVTVLPQ